MLVEEPRDCSYLDDRYATLEHKIQVDVTPPELEAMLERGWRRFGPDYFRPACRDCSECVPTRVPVAAFHPSKSQRRAARGLDDFVIRVGPPRFDDERLSLYHAWHASREGARGWDAAFLTEKAYRIQFTFPHPAAREITFTDPSTGRLVGVGLCDETPHAWSAIYFFYDPTFARASLGTMNVLAQLRIAERRGIPHVYLGYRVEACASLAYKANYRPQERLVGWPEMDEAPVWAAIS